MTPQRVAVTLVLATALGIGATAVTTGCEPTGCSEIEGERADFHRSVCGPTTTLEPR